MNCLEMNPILNFNPNQMTEVRKTFGYGDINRLYQDIKLFEDWIKTQHHFAVKEFDKKYLERYLISSKGSIETAKRRLDKLCTIRGLMPDYLQGFDIKNEFKNVFKVSQLCLLSRPTPDNFRVIWYVLNNPDTAYFDHSTVARYLLVMIEYLYFHDYNAGIEIVVDTRKMTLGIVTKLSPVVVANTMVIITEALGLRIRGMHFISGSKVIDTIISIVKQGMSKKLMSRIHVHENFEALFNFIPKDILPTDIGGDLGTLQEISERNFEEFSSHDFLKKLKYMEGAKTDEQKRIRCQFNEEYSGMPGSFKVLSVD